MGIFFIKLQKKKEKISLEWNEREGGKSEKFWSIKEPKLYF